MKTLQPAQSFGEKIRVRLRGEPYVLSRGPWHLRQSAPGLPLEK